MAQAEQYFAAEPQSKDVRKTLHVTLRGNEADVEVSNGVFSGNRVDLGTSVLLSGAGTSRGGHVPRPGLRLGANRVGVGLRFAEGGHLGVGRQ